MTVPLAAALASHAGSVPGAGVGLGVGLGVGIPHVLHTDDRKLVDAFVLLAVLNHKSHVPNPFAVLSLR
jgi:hypothetical protein